MMSQRQTDENFLKMAIIDSLKLAVEREFEICRKNLNERLDQQKAEIVSSIALRMMRHVTMERMGEILSIEVNLGSNQSNLPKDDER